MASRDPGGPAALPWTRCIAASGSMLDGAAATGAQRLPVHAAAAGPGPTQLPGPGWAVGCDQGPCFARRAWCQPRGIVQAGYGNKIWKVCVERYLLAAPVQR